MRIPYNPLLRCDTFRVTHAAFAQPPGGEVFASGPDSGCWLLLVIVTTELLSSVTRASQAL